MIILKRFSLWLSLAGILVTIAVLATAQKKEPMPQPIEPPPRTPFETTVAASGIIEAVNENVRIAPPVAGLITKVFVHVGDTIPKGNPLVQLDDRALRAQLLTRQAAIPTSQEKIAEQAAKVEDLRIQYLRLKNIKDRRAVSDDTIKRTWYAYQGAKRGLARARAELNQAKAQRQETTALLERLTVRAPREGTVLQVNIRAGEYAMPGGTEPLILLGDTNQLQVRADVDEVNAPLIKPGSPAIAYPKGATTQPIQLTFVRIEPYIIPKKSLTGDNRERVDTRVLQVIYRFTPPPFPVYTGQQVDVFIQRAPNSQSGTMTKGTNRVPKAPIQPVKKAPTEQDP